MKEQFCNYDISLKLKKLGFDEECLCTYVIGDKRFQRIPSNNMAGEEIEEPYTWVNSKIHESVMTAPLWQQVIDWFRNKYNLLIDSPKLDEWNIGKWSVKITSLDKSIVLEEYVSQPYWRIYRCFRTYEEAREQAILKAIEILELPKD